MVDICIYRSRIGTFLHSRRLKSKQFDKFILSQESRGHKAGKAVLKGLVIFMKLVVLSIFVFAGSPCSLRTSMAPVPCSQSPWWRSSTTASPGSGRGCSLEWSSTDQTYLYHPVWGKNSPRTF